MPDYHSPPHWQTFPIAEFGAHAEAWRALNSATADCPALDPDFVIPLLEHFGNPRARLCIAGIPHEPTAMTIVLPVKFAVWETLQPSQAPVGLRLARLGLAMDSLVPPLLRKLPGATVLFGLSQLDPDIVPTDSSGAPQLQKLDYIQTGRITINGSFDE